jgi:Fic family protein
MKVIRKSPAGTWIRSLEGFHTFVPNPVQRTMGLDPSLVYLLDQASRGVAMLAGVGETLPDPHLLIRPFLRREAVLSSRIEGTQSSLSDLFVYEATKGSKDRTGDAREVANYVMALEYGLEQLDRLPISMRLINQIHGRLLERVRGKDKGPGELRTRQVWIGEQGTKVEEARFVPAPAEMIRDLMTDLEVFMNEELEMPPLIKAALMHYQFEAIHPYLDGNGRVGRLLITLLLCAEDVLPTPLLYLSAYFEKHRDEYYERLLNVSEKG